MMASVSSLTALSLTKEFKELIYSENQAGASPREILDRYGFDMKALGKYRIHSIGVNIRREHDKYGGFHQGYLRLSQQPDSGAGEEPAKSESERIRQLQELDGAVTEFDENLWSSLVDHIIVMRGAGVQWTPLGEAEKHRPSREARRKVVFTFKGGTEITV